MTTALLIDARNALYRSIYASKAERYNRYHSMTFLLRQIAAYIRQFSATEVHVFWDAPRESVWRRKILSTYKDRSSSQYVEDITTDLRECTEISQEMFKYLNFRQYSRKCMEADDLIYSAVAVMHPKRTIIVSSDSDMMQIPFLFSSNSVIDPKTMSINEVPEHNPSLMKALVGDKSDHIDGYYGIGPKKGAMLLENYNHLQEFLQLKGRDIYIRNLLLTDLSLCPKLMANKIYIQQVMSENLQFDKEIVSEIVKKYKILGFSSEYSNIIPLFMKLGQ